MKSSPYRFAYVVAVAAASFFFMRSSHAASPLLFVSDLVSTSNPATSTDQTITFKVLQAVPAGGQLVITPDAAFVIPSTLDYTSFDLALSGSSTGPFTDRTLAAAPSATDDGVSVNAS